MYDFTKKAIRCTEWSQMEHLAKLAEQQGQTEFLFSVEDFEFGANLFYSDGSKFTNATLNTIGAEDTTYSDFIASTTHPHQSVEGC